MDFYRIVTGFDSFVHNPLFQIAYGIVVCICFVLHLRYGWSICAAASMMRLKYLERLNEDLTIGDVVRMLISSIVCMPLMLAALSLSIEVLCKIWNYKLIVTVKVEKRKDS